MCRHDLSDVDPHPERERDFIGLIVTRHHVLHGESRENRTLGIVLVRERCAEERHDGVADELVDVSLVLVDGVRQAPEKAVHQDRDAFGIHLLGHGGKTGKVREQDDDLPPVTLKLGLDRLELLAQGRRGFRFRRGLGGGVESGRFVPG